MKITVQRVNGERRIYRGDKLIANIYDNRKRKGYAGWAVAWTTGRYDQHGTYAEARDNALKGL